MRGVGVPGVAFWWYTSENLSPRVSPAFLARQRRLLLPGQYANEHENRWHDRADAYTTSVEVDDAMDGSWVETPVGEPGRDYVIAVDIGLITNPAVVGIGHQENGLVCVDRLVTFQGSREDPVQLRALEATIVELTSVFPVSRIIVESWQGEGLVQSLTHRGWPAESFKPTPTAVAPQWTILARCLADRRLVLPVHDRLREELLNLQVEVGPAGVRVLDRGQIHQDHCVVTRMLAASLVGVKPEPLRLVMLG